MRNSQIWITYVGKNLAHRLPLIKCLSNKISAMEYRWLLKRAGANHFRFWNSLNAFLHAKMISYIFILPWTSSNKTNHKRVYNSHILKYYLAEDIYIRRPWSRPEWLGDLFLPNRLPFKAFMISFPRVALMWRPGFPADPRDLFTVCCLGKPSGNLKEFTGF